MAKVRIIVKKTFQPPIDTPASITHETVVVESERLNELLSEPQGAGKTAQVIGAEPITENGQHNG